MAHIVVRLSKYTIIRGTPIKTPIDYSPYYRGYIGVPL